MNFIVSSLFALLALSAQPKADSTVYPKNYFKSPLDIPLTLAANFGEPRKGHFHAGLDLRTNEKTGYKVYAAAGGYVSRINVSSTGYGNALYITHPNGYVTVYGHLESFAPQMAERLRKEQYEKKSFSIDFSLKPDEIPVKQGEVVARSGNTGGSGGPHLHFEIRDSLERPVNPQLFGIKLKDDLPPPVNYVKLYPMDDLKYKSAGYRIKTSGSGGRFTVGEGTIRLNASAIGISINTYDIMNATGSLMGIYDIKLYDNAKLLYEYTCDKFSFKEGRYVISQIDYPIFLQAGRKAFYKCFVEPGNKAPLYSNLVDKGIVRLADGREHVIKIEVSDFAGNISAVNFKVKQDKANGLFKKKDPAYVKRFDYDKDNEFSAPDIKINIPKGCLFDTLYFNYSSGTSKDTGIYSKMHYAGSPVVQTFEKFMMEIKPEKLNERLYDKALIVSKDEDGDENVHGGKYENGFISAKVREFGTYYIRIDTTPPRITPLNINDGKKLLSGAKILFKITDNLSGIAKFDTYVDDKWALTNYDAKSSTLTHILDPSLEKGEHVFKVVVADERRNVAQYIVKFVI